MFLPIMCNSVNKREMVLESSLIGTCSHYKSDSNLSDIFFFEYDGVESKRLIACDLAIYSNTGDIFIHDFMLLKDGNWRNSFGSVSNSLAELLPDEILNSILISREQLAEFESEN